MKKLLMTMLAVMPMMANAEYDVEHMKKELLTSESLQVNGWKINEAGNAWLAEHDMPNTVLSVNSEQTGMMVFVSNELQALVAMLDCTTLGDIGLGLKDDPRVDAVVTEAVEKQIKTSWGMDDVVFSVELLQVGDVVGFSCVIAPIN